MRYWIEIKIKQFLSIIRTKSTSPGIDISNTYTMYLHQGELTHDWLGQQTIGFWLLLQGEKEENFKCLYTVNMYMPFLSKYIHMWLWCSIITKGRLNLYLYTEKQCNPFHFRFQSFPNAFLITFINYSYTMYSNILLFHTYVCLIS